MEPQGKAPPSSPPGKAASSSNGAPAGSGNGKPPGPSLRKSQLGDRLRQARQALGLTLADIASKLGESEKRLERIEENSPYWPPNLTEIEQLAGCLDVSPRWLAYGDRSQRAPAEDRLRSLCAQFEADIRDETEELRSTLEQQSRTLLERTVRKHRRRMERDYQRKLGKDTEAVRQDLRSTHRAELDGSLASLRAELEQTASTELPSGCARRKSATWRGATSRSPSRRLTAVVVAPR